MMKISILILIVCLFICSVISHKLDEDNNEKCNDRTVTVTITDVSTTTSLIPTTPTPFISGICQFGCVQGSALANLTYINSTENESATAITYQECLTFCQLNAPGYTMFSLLEEYGPGSVPGTQPPSSYNCECFSGIFPIATQENCPLSYTPGDDGNYYTYGITYHMNDVLFAIFGLCPN
jgi:hypothetical protein